MTKAGTSNDARLDRQTWRRFVVAVGNFATSEVRGRAAALAATLLGLLLAISGLNVVNSYVGRDFMTAIEHRDRAGFLREALLLRRRVRRIDRCGRAVPLRRGAAWTPLARVADAPDRRQLSR